MLSFVAGLWAALGAGGVPLGARGMVAVACTVVVLGSAVWFWRRPRARAGGLSVDSAPCSMMARKVELAIPPGLDGEQVLAAARGRFMGLQAAWDAGDVPTLQNLTTPEMLEELLHVLTSREARHLKRIAAARRARAQEAADTSSSGTSSVWLLPNSLTMRGG